MAFGGEDQGAVLIHQRLAGLRLQFQPAQTRLPHPARIELVPAMDRADHAVVVRRRRPGVPRLPPVDQRDGGAAPPQLQRRHHPGDAGADDNRFHRSPV